MKDVVKKLESLDWNFADKSSKKDIHSIHPYPAKFISAIPKQLIETIGLEKGLKILDPFCGSGTTLAVAQELGFDSIGIDLNPIACLISRVKTTQIRTIDETLVDIIISRADKTSPDIQELNIDIPNVDHWFERHVQIKIIAIRQEILKVVDDDIRNVLLLSLSSILVKVSNQESDTRYAAISKSIDSYDVYKHLKSAFSRITSLLSSVSYEHKNCEILNSNILDLDTSNIEKKVGLVVTSPPYPNAYEYWLYHKYRMFWLNHDPIRVKELEIGARAHFFKKNHHTPEDFFHQMKKTIEKSSSICVDSAVMAFVVGRSKIHGEIIDNAAIIKRAGEELGLKHLTTIKREMKSSRKSFNLSHAMIKEESIVILQR